MLALCNKSMKRWYGKCVYVEIDYEVKHLIPFNNWYFLFYPGNVALVSKMVSSILPIVTVVNILFLCDLYIYLYISLCPYKYWNSQSRNPHWLFSNCMLLHLFYYIKDFQMSLSLPQYHSIRLWQIDNIQKSIVMILFDHLFLFWNCYI